MREIFFVSDTHFGHKNIIKYSNRPFADSREMDEVLIDNWNKLINPNDLVFHLGDFALTSRGRGEYLLKVLNGEKHLVIGNHDEKGSKKYRGWSEVYYYRQLHINTEKIIICHYPVESWNGKHRGYLHFHGHCHGSLKQKLRNRVDVGVDVGANMKREKYRPLHLSEIKEYIDVVHNPGVNESEVDHHIYGGL